MAKKVTVVLAMRDNYTAVVKKARSYTSAFQKDVAKMTKQLDKASKEKRDMRIETSKAMKRLNALEKKLAPMREVMVKVAANVQHFKNKIKPVTDTFKKVATKAWTITLKVKDGVSFVLTKINTALKKIGKVALIGAGAAVAAGGYALSKGMALEGYDVSMSHFVGVNNPNASQGQVQKQTQDYLKWLRKNANATPFGTEEVIQAGSRAVQIAEGNTKAAQGLVKMAEDMAALTPGKTIMDAMEALADANMGEMERMKEFGFKMSAEEFKKAGYDLFSTKSTTGKTLVEVFGGGAEKFANTTTGMWSTITGEIESEIAAIGLLMADGLKPFLQWVRDSVLPDIKKFITEPLKGTGKTGMETLTDGIKWLYYWLKEQIPLAINTIKGAWEGFAKWLNDPNGILRQALGILGINLPTVTTQPEPTKYDPEQRRRNVAHRTKNGGVSADQSVPTNTQSAGRQLNLGDAIMAFYGVNVASAISKAITGKGLISNGVKMGVKAGGTAATALGAASPAANVAMANGASWFSKMMAAGGSTLMPAAYHWWQNQKSLASFDYYEKTGKTDFDNAPWGDKAAVWLNRALPGLNGWLPPGLVDGINNLQNGANKGADGLSLAFTQPDAALENFKKNLGFLFGNASSAADSVTKVAEALQTPTATTWSGIPDEITAIGTAAEFSYAKFKALRDLLDGGPSSGGGAGPMSVKHAAGIKRVPFDNYPALLHKGETVLPSGEAGEYRGHGNQAAKGGNTFHVAIHVNGGSMDENRLASFIVNKLQEVALNTP